MRYNVVIMIGVNNSKELLGISEEVLLNIPVIGNARCEVLSYRPDIDLDIPNNKKHMEIEWPASSTNNGGIIGIMFSDKITPNGFSEGGSNFLVTYHESEEKGYRSGIKNSKEGSAALLTSLATINRAAEKSGNQIQHVVVANKHTRKFFERLRKTGLYKYSDEQGNESHNQIETGHGILFITTFPIRGLGELLKDFVIEEAADKINTLRN